MGFPSLSGLNTRKPKTAAERTKVLNKTSVGLLAFRLTPPIFPVKSSSFRLCVDELNFGHFQVVIEPEFIEDAEQCCHASILCFPINESKQLRFYENGLPTQKSKAIPHKTRTLMPDARSLASKVVSSLPFGSPKTDIAEHHLTALFTSITNGTTVDQQQLEKFLNGLHLSSPDHAHDEEHVHNETIETHCYSAEQMIEFFPNSQTLTKQQFGELLPTVVYELHTHACHHEHSEHGHSRALDWKAIVGSTVSVLVISISGLIVVALIPLMPRRFFNVISQFLIALSVGSLTGDAFLHLIPHALAPEHDHGHEDQTTANVEPHNHHEMIGKALVALLGIYAFFLTERLTILCQNNTSRQKMKRQRVVSSYHVSVWLFVHIGSGHGSPTSEPALTFPVAFIFHKASNNEAVGEKDLTYPPISGAEQNGSLPMETEKQESTNVMQPVGLRSREHGTPNTKPSVDSAGNLTLAVNGVTSHMENELCGRPPDRPLDNARCADHLSGDVFVRVNSASLIPGGAHHKNQQDGAVHFCWPSSVYIPPTELTSSERSTATELPTQNAVADASELTRRQRPEASYDMVDVDNRNGQISKWKQNATFAESNLAKTYLDTAEEQPTHPHRDKPHGHHHGHSHDLSSVRAIAYTVIVGDGLHNFCDGIAIGAAFSTNVNGGLSTAIAVLCHELPHELGDFAVLLHAGMSVKAAIFYNLLSSILCAAGTVIGLLLGRIASIDTWIFMLTAGMFVYIALVDMMPELATNRLKGQRCCHRPSILFIWQNVGILLGYGIMLLIAFYETQLT
ncbi:metal cation transporter, ZIP family [Opisthorchis viverrini]|uniref:Metal cation transporter, ZIP family n=1 Tax=Opisthorchis viverrini TaxID=6198 RepID=A0A1S8WKI7_OPIVI|nr:metal cation transporter, ZIP family [Opisthorchis viverrini]